MTQHYTSNTVSVSRWCNKCHAFTLHKVSGHRVGHCISCAEKQETEHQRRSSGAPVPKQERLFG